MRLRDIQHALEDAALPSTPPVDRPVQMANGESGVRFRNFSALKRALRILVHVAALEPYVKPILNNEALMSHYGDTFVGSVGQFDPVANQVGQLCRVVSLLKEMLAQVLPPERPASLAVQIPEPGSLDNLKEQVDELRVFFNVLAKIGFEDDNGEHVIMQPEVQAFDSGSFYIELILQSATAVACVGVVMRGAYQVSVLWENWKQTQARIAMGEALAKDAASIADHNSKIRAALAASVAKDLRNGRLSKVHGEGEAALRTALMQGSEMLEKRVVFLPPPTAPKDILMSFPGQKAVEHLFSDEGMKLLNASLSGDQSEAAVAEDEDKE